MNELIEIDNSVTEINESHLTPAREKILEALLNPEFLGLSITEKCNLIGISRNCWYKAIKDQSFMSLVKKTNIDLIKESAHEIIAASKKVAINSGARGFNDRRMLLEMSGYYVPKSEVNGEFNLRALLDPEERRKRINELEQKT